MPILALTCLGGQPKFSTSRDASVVSTTLLQYGRELCAEIRKKQRAVSVSLHILLVCIRRIGTRDDADVDTEHIVTPLRDLGGIAGAEFNIAGKRDAR
jgi:hypothetical protein